MKKFLQLNNFKFWITIVFIYLSSFFNMLFAMRVKNPGDMPATFILDFPINSITGIINQLFGLLVPPASQNIIFLAINSFVSVLSFALNILYYYVLACLVYYLFNKLLAKKMQLKNKKLKYFKQ